MAEWIGHLMAGWPTWVIGVGAVIILSVGAIIYWILDIWVWQTPRIERKKSHGKK